MLGGCASAPSTLHLEASAPMSPHLAIAIVPVSRAAKSDLAGIDRLDRTDYAKAALQGLGMGAASGWAAGGLLTFAFAAGPAGIAAVPYHHRGCRHRGRGRRLCAGRVRHRPFTPGDCAAGCDDQRRHRRRVCRMLWPRRLPRTSPSGRPFVPKWWRTLPPPAWPAAHDGGPAGPEGFDSVLQVEITQFGFAGATRAGTSPCTWSRKQGFSTRAIASPSRCADWPM